MKALLMHAGDDVALAAVTIPAGSDAEVDGRKIRVPVEVPFGHKLALRPITAGEVVVKYGQPIGRALVDIALGEHVHDHNLESLRGRGDLAAGATTVGASAQAVEAAGTQLRATAGSTALDPALAALTFPGYRRKDGRAGVRNHVLVLSTVQCANAVVDRIGRLLPEVAAITHVYGCSQIGADLEQTQRVFDGFTAHPNVGAVLLVGLGCESVPTVEMGERLRAAGIPSHRLTIQEEGGTRKTLERGLALTRELLQEVSGAERVPCPLSDLIVATECGGSDAWSGVTANPAVGRAADLIVRAGGTVILSEVPEFIGAEELLAARAASPEVARQIIEYTRGREAGAMAMGVDMRGSQPTPGNMAGGLTTIEEKSLGAITKGGTTPAREFLPYAYRPTQRGLVVMDTPGNDPESVTAMVAGGAQIVLFTTGRGSPTGCPIAPVIKVASNTEMYTCLQEDMDVDAGTVVDGHETLDDVGQRILDEILAVSAGKQTAAESWGHTEFAITAIGPRL